MVPRYVVTVWYKNGSVFAETFTQLKSAQAAYKRFIEPSIPHSLVNYVLIANVVDEYRHNSYTAMKGRK